MLEVKIREWLSVIANEGKVPTQCKAVYVGLFESVDGRYMLSFLGSVDFDEEDDDWACEEDDDYYPQNRYLDSEVSTKTNWEEFQETVLGILKSIRNEKGNVLSDVKHVGVGFDSGDLAKI
jgi:hypothetical protein